MPKISPEPVQQSIDPFRSQMSNTLQTVGLTLQPVFVCGVSRKVNTGNYENIDIYAGLTIPLSGGTIEEKEELKEMVAAAADLGFGLVSEETSSRYTLLKEMQRSGRK